MVTIFVLGLDQYVVGHYSKENSANLANLMKIEEEELNFYAPYSVIFHKGVEQTSWHTEVFVRLPERLRPLEEKIAHYLLDTLNEVSIHVEVSFDYFKEGKRYSVHKDPYPRYIEEEQLVDVTADNEDEEEEADPRDRADLDINNPDEIYLGNAFAGHEKELEGLDKEDSHDECHCGHCHHKG